MTDRVTYQVQPAQGINAHGWEVKREDAYRATETNITGYTARNGERVSPKEEAIEIAEDYAESLWEDRGTPTQVKIRKQDGSWASDRGMTYGHDPYPPRG